MTRILLFIRRAAAWFRTYSLEITLHGQNTALESVRDPATRQRIILARSNTRRELERTASSYIALRRIARNRSWRAA